MTTPACKCGYYSAFEYLKVKKNSRNKWGNIGGEKYGGGGEQEEEEEKEEGIE